jgi:hypothetical protein
MEVTAPWMTNLLRVADGGDHSFKVREATHDLKSRLEAPPPRGAYGLKAT